MKTILRILAVCLVSFHSIADNGIKLIQGQGNTLQITVDFTDFELVDAGIIDGIMHSRISAENAYPSLLLGNPDLHRMVESIQLPAKGSSELKIIEASYTEYFNIELVPSKGKLYRNVDPSTVPYSKSEIYSNDAFYPNQIANLNSPFVFRSTRGQSIEIVPFQYNPITKVLRVYHHIELEIEVNSKESGLNEIEETKVRNKQIHRMNERHFLNYSHTKYDPVDEDGTLLIICKDNLMTDMEEFVNWKIKKGIPTEMVAISEVGNSQNSIYNFVKNYYTSNPELVYLLLVGDHADVNCYNAGNAGSEIKWSDSKYGLVAGTNDWYPDVFVGRFSASTSTNLQRILSRNMEYETAPLSGDWYKKAIGLGSNEGQGIGYLGMADWQHLRNIRADLLNYGFTEVYEFYDGSHGGEDASGSPNSTMIKNAVNEGVTLFNYTGHGDQNVCVTGNFTSSHISQATNNGKYPFVISVACNNGTFTSGSCISEAWMLAANANGTTGAISTCGSSILMSWAPPMATQVEMTDILVESYASNRKFTLGGLFYNGQMKMMDVYNGQGKEVVETWVFFGDPSVKIRTQNPIDLTVTHQEEATIGATSILIQTCNQEGTLISLTQNNVLIGTGIVVNGSVQVDLIAPIDMMLDITVVGTAYNCRPYEGTIKIIEEEVAVNTGFTLYPNPISVNGELNIGLSLNEATTVKVKIFNTVGQIVREVSYTELDKGQYIETIQMTDLGAGMYEIVTLIGSEEFMEKFIIK